MSGLGSFPGSTTGWNLGTRVGVLLMVTPLQDRGNTPLHVASQAGQAMQVELLTVHGANPCTLDRLGHTPEECARWEEG